jgi:radical SAM superfamily enzyme YgiQ (UPF0313 family)
MKICLINPGKYFHQPPLGLAYIAAYLRKYSEFKNEITIADQNVNGDIKDEILEFKPDIVGITSVTPQFSDAMKIAQFIKEHFPAIQVIIGGIHVSALPEETIRMSCFDIGVIGEGEQTFLELMNLFEKNRKPSVSELSKVKGIIFKNNGNIITTERRSLIMDLDTIPFPARDLLDMEYYLKPKVVVRGLVKRATQIMTSRGCPYDCIFCGSHLINGRIFRAHSPEHVIEEIEYLVEGLKAELLYFQDDTFIIQKDRARRISELLIEKGLNKKFMWCAQLRANLVSKKDTDLLKLMKEAGLIQAEFGFESGCEKSLSMLKGNSVTVKNNQEALGVCKKVGLRVLGNFMIGLPTETEDDINETKEFILKNNRLFDVVDVHITTPYPGTKLWNICKENGLLKNVNWGEDFWMRTSRGRENYSLVLDEKRLKSLYRDLQLIALERLSLFTKLKFALDNPYGRKNMIKMAFPYLLLKFKDFLT